MRSSAVQFVFALLALVIGAAVEDTLPKFLGVGFPVLLASALHVASHRASAAVLLFAVAAGAFEDALSSLPPLTSVSFFLGVALLAHRFELPRLSILAVYPLFHLWLGVWSSDLVGNIFVRVLVAVPMGGLTALATAFALAWAEGKAGIDERE